MTLDRYAVYLALAISASSCGDNSFGPHPPPDPDHVTVDTSPAWSPGGTTIAYYRFFPSSAGPPGIYIIQSDGANNRLLLESPNWTRDLRFSPDSTRLSMTIGLEIYILDLQDQTLRQLTNTQGNAEWGDWSPDRRFLVYSGPFVRDGGLRIIEIATGTNRALTNNRARVYGINPRWSPQGEPIVFWASDNAAHQDVFTIRSDGGDLRRLTDSNGENAVAEDPRWFNGGSHLLYFSRQQDDPSDRETRIIRSDGSEQATWPVFINYYDSISPDSRRIVAAALQDSATIDGVPVWVLFTRNVDDASGASLRQLTSYRPPQGASGPSPVAARVLVGTDRLARVRRAGWDPL